MNKKEISVEFMKFYQLKDRRQTAAMAGWQEYRPGSTVSNINKF